jgi:1,4-alpha-glucan branching enzyme
LSASTHGADIVGEDLGTVPDEVRAAMDDHRVRRMQVAQFAIDPESNPVVAPAPPRSVASFGSHDLPTFTGWWEGRGLSDTEIDRRVVQREALWRATVGDNPPRSATRKGLDGVHRTLAEGPAGTVMVALEDLWLERDQQNVPGTPSSENWTRKAARPLEQLADDTKAAKSLAVLAKARPWQPTGARPPEVTASGGTVFGVSLLTTDDLHLFNEGRHFQLHRKLGAHLITADGQDGTYFAVWAPDASSVAVIGDWNDWDGERHPLRPVQSSGIWEGFVPGVGKGARYKYRVRSRIGHHVADKSDPFAFRTEEPPATASVVWDLEYEWRDTDWIGGRADKHAADRPLSVYEVHLGSWRRVPGEGGRFLSYREIAPLLADHCLEMGFTHVELLPVMEHPFYGSWGYQTTGYFAATGRYGSPQDLMALIDHLHQRGIGVILDWVPSHFPSDAHGLAFFDGTHLYEHADPRKRVHPDWGSYEFNYGRNEVRSFLVSAALFWVEQYHADGLRTDAVASMLYLDYSRNDGEWIPNRYGGRENLEAVEFLRVCNTELGSRFPDVLTFAEESTSWPGVTRPAVLGGLGFMYKWDLGWMHDTLEFIGHDPIHRGWHLDALTFRMLYAYSEKFVLTLSHDEVVHGKGSLLAKMPGDPWQQMANLRLLVGYQHGMPGKKLLFAGAEFGQWREWNHDESLEWHLLHQPQHAGMQRWVAELNRLHQQVPALHELDYESAGFEWIECRDRDTSVLAWLRYGHDRDDPVLLIANFTPVPRPGYRVGVPFDGQWRMLANGDDRHFGGSGYSQADRFAADGPPAQGRPRSLTLDVPPLTLVMLRRDGSHR